MKKRLTDEFVARNSNKKIRTVIDTRMQKGELLLPSGAKLVAKGGGWWELYSYTSKDTPEWWIYA